LSSCSEQPPETAFYAGDRRFARRSADSSGISPEIAFACCKKDIAPARKTVLKLPCAQAKE
jgi:hypothetical protein